MSRIFDALDHARDQGGWRNVRGESAAPLPVAASRAGASMPAALSRVGMEQEMVRLRQHLVALFPDKARRVIQFIGSREGEGTSTVAREFAGVSATRFGQRVLLLETSRRGPVQGPYEIGADGTPAGVAPSRAGGATFATAPLPQEFTASHAADDPGPAAGRERLRQAYDLVVIDSPPATTSPEGLAACGQADGVVLVVAAEETRWPVAQRAKESIERSGGRVIGIALNKRQYYIPDFIYKRL